MGSSPPSVTPRTDDIRASQLLEDGGTRKVGTGTLQQVGNGKYANVPQMVAELLGAQVGHEADIFVNIEQRVVIHQFSNGEGK